MGDLGDQIRRIHLAFDPSDSRRQDIRDLACAVDVAEAALAKAQAEAARLRAVVDEIHEAVGESPASDDATLPGFVLHIQEDVRRKALEEAAAYVRSAAHGRGFLASTGVELLRVADELNALSAREVDHG